MYREKEWNIKEKGRIKKERERTGSVAQEIEYLLYKHKDLNSNPREV
jgi:hypothetical protein